MRGILFSVAMAATLALAGCGDDPKKIPGVPGTLDASGSGSTGNGKLECTTSISTGTIEYKIESGVTSMRPTGGDWSAMTRVSGDSASIYGSYNIPYPASSSGSSVSLSGVLTVSQGKLSVTNTCTGLGQTKSSTVTVSATLTPSEIVINESGSATN